LDADCEVVCLCWRVCAEHHMSALTCGCCCAQDIGDIVIGSVLGDSSQRAIQCRVASLLAGIPETVPVHTVNRCDPARAASAEFAGDLQVC